MKFLLIRVNNEIPDLDRWHLRMTHCELRGIRIMYGSTKFFSVMFSQVLNVCC